MNKSPFLSNKAFYSLATVVATAGLMLSCAQDGYDDDERFESAVKGVTLTSPEADAITVTASADGKTQTIVDLWIKAVYDPEELKAILKRVSDNWDGYIKAAKEAYGRE